MKINLTWFRFQSRWWLAAVVLVGLAVWSREAQVGGFGWPEASRHAMDGAFLLDLIGAHPVGHLGEWSRNYFTCYPCLGILDSDPPFFAAVEALFYAVLDVSVFTARSCVIFFTLAGTLAMYWVARQLFDRAAGILAAGLWASLPATVLWSREVMLEVPTTAMILLCAGCYLRYQSTRSLVWLILTLMGRWAEK